MSGTDKRKRKSQKDKATYKGKKIIDKGKKDGRKRRRCSCTRPKARTEQTAKSEATKSTTAIESRLLQHLHINWSNFKPEFSGKPEEAETHLLHSSDWMNAHYL